MEALSDGVFAIVMIILVRQLGGSAISDAETATQLEAALISGWCLVFWGWVAEQIRHERRGSVTQFG